MAKKTRKAKANIEQWEPSLYDAMNLAYLRYSVMEIEQTAISIYAGDDKTRKKFNALVVDLADFLTFIRAKYKGPSTPKKKKNGVVDSDQCYDSWVLCSGMCVPPDQCDR